MAAVRSESCNKETYGTDLVFRIVHHSNAIRIQVFLEHYLITVDWYSFTTCLLLSSDIGQAEIHQLCLLRLMPDTHERERSVYLDATSASSGNAWFGMILALPSFFPRMINKAIATKPAMPPTTNVPMSVVRCLILSLGGLSDFNKFSSTDVGLVVGIGVGFPDGLVVGILETETVSSFAGARDGAEVRAILV